MILATSLLLASCQTTVPSKMNAVTALLVPEQVRTEEMLVKEGGFLPAQVGYLVLEGDSRKTIIQANPDGGFIPASVTKLPTMLAALHILGSSFRFKTSLAYRGKISGGILNGDLYLKGTGDPLLTMSDLMSLVEALRQRHIKQIQGAFYFDDSTFPRQEKINDFLQDDAVYNTGISALSSEFNRLVMRWSPDPLSKTLRAYSIPDFSWLTMTMNSSSDAKSSKMAFTKTGETESWSLSSNLDKEGFQALPIKDGGRFTASLVARLCHQEGITLATPLRGELPKDAKLIAQHESLPLSELVGKNWEYSNNLMAELVMLTAASKVARRRVSTVSQAADRIKAWLVKEIPEISWSGFEIENGSGLSPKGRISPRQIVGILQWGERQHYDGKSLISLLPISGWKGSLENHLDSPVTGLKVWAKTGTLDFARALSGYFFSNSNKRYLFTIFVTDFEKRKRRDLLPHMPDNGEDSDEASDWLKHAKQLEADLLTKWIQQM